MNINSDFSKARAGDKCWSIEYGQAIIVEVDLANSLITVKDVKHKNIFKTYTLEGKAIGHYYPSLFHEKPDCFKQKVEKTIELEGFYYYRGKLFHVRGDLKGDSYPAKAVITYEEEK